MIDAHLHLQDARFAGTIPSLLETTRSLGISRLVVNGTHPDDWDSVEELARTYPEVTPCYGLHPWLAGTEPAGWLADLEARLLRNPDAGIGEIGLDRWIRRGNFDAQLEAFDAQIGLARRLDRPVSIHCLQAWGKLIERLEAAALPRGFLLHSYGGPGEMVRTFVAAGAFFSLSGYFFRPGKEGKLAVFDLVPDDRILLETDAPDMVPPNSMMPFQGVAGNGGAVNHPGNLVAVYEAFAARRGMPVQDLEALIERNFGRWWGRQPGLAYATMAASMASKRASMP